jgi:hypothetical protein
MPPRRNRTRKNKRTRARTQKQRGGGKREIRVSLAYGSYGPEFDKVQIEGIKKYRELFFKQYKVDHGEQWADDYSKPNPPRVGQAPFGWTCGEPHESTCGKGVTCGSHRYFTPGQRKEKQRRCVPTFGFGTLFKEPYATRQWYEEDNWYLEPKIVGDPPFRQMIIDEFKTLNILKELQLPKQDTITIMKKLKDYKYVDEVSDLKYGTYLRWISIEDPENLYLTNGAIFCEVKVTDNGILLVCKNHGYIKKHFCLSMDKNLIFQRLTQQEQVLLSALDHLSS